MLAFVLLPTALAALGPDEEPGVEVEPSSTTNPEAHEPRHRATGAPMHAAGHHTAPHPGMHPTEHGGPHIASDPHAVAGHATPGHHGPMMGVQLTETAGHGHLKTGVCGQLGVPMAHGALEAELVAGAHGSEHGTVVPIELLLEVPMHFGQHVDAFVGLGPGVELHPTQPGHPVTPTGSVAVGGRTWWGHAGFGAEVGYTMLLDEQSSSEVKIAVGPLFRL